MPSVDTAPRFSADEAARVAREVFAVEGESRELPSERDQNFRLRTTGGRELVLKIANPRELRDRLAFQNEVMTVLAADPGGPLAPRPLPAGDGSTIAVVPGRGGEPHFVRLVEYLPGRPLGEVRPHTPRLLMDLGGFAARLVRALSALAQREYQPDLIWNLKNGLRVVRENAPLVVDPARRATLDAVFRTVEERAALFEGLPEGLVHNDGNDYNVIVAPPEATPGSFGDMRVAGFIDFGDMTRSWVLSDVAVVLAYAMLDKDDPLGDAALVVSGYNAVLPLSDEDLRALFPLACLRLCMSVSICAMQKKLDPGNSYLTISEEPAWRLLERLKDVPPAFAEGVSRQACGRPPFPAADAVVRWLEANRVSFAPVMGYPLDARAVTVFDLGPASALFEREEHWTDMEALDRLLQAEVLRAGARAGLGRYDEARLIYTSPVFRPSGDPLAEGRTVHLGMDVFVPPGSDIFAPLDGTVHSFRDNAARLDYGPTIILEHAPAPGVRFYTLYGHLSRGSLARLEPGKTVLKGERLAAVGAMDENGGWPPHLHFQIIVDMLGRSGDFPGVAPHADRGLWTALSPDPNLILGVADELLRDPALAPAEIIEMRREHLGRNLSLSYRAPLAIVRGSKQHLIDRTGRVFLDAVNNVPHVGHSHPKVVEAVRKQASVLNTNTRYLHETIVRYARRLTALLPDPLKVCFFVNSGSEANDLALRLAAAYTGRRDVIVLDGAYHGNLSSLIAISPYKFDRPGGAGCPPSTHVAPTPDPYRGLYRDDPRAGGKYAARVGAILEDLKKSGRLPAAFIAEPILSCAGQIVPPPGFLKEAFQLVREAGGVSIADEVQVGFGRCGTHFWAFETQEAAPDILTLGKPIGNGHPLGAVITTPAIADAFSGGMEYFNTFGGNPVSCAAGMAVLDVIEEEGLQENARTTGALLAEGLRSLMVRHPIVGDIRGLGLFLGVEFVLDRATREPAPLHAAYAVERMREEGVLLSTDGPDRNVIKIKPPLCFTAADADLLVGKLDRVLSETPYEFRRRRRASSHGL